MGHRRWKMTEVFEGPVKFGADADTGSRDMTFYGATTGSKIVIDTSADEMYLDGMDLWLKDDDQLEFGNSSDVVMDWSAGGGFTVLPAAAGSAHTLGSSTYYWAADWNLSEVDIDLYGTNPDVNINRNLTSGVTNAPVVTMKQDNASDDQVTLKVEQDANVAAVDINGALDIDGVAGFTSGSLVDINRNLTSGATDAAVVTIKQDNASDDMTALKVDQDAGDYLAADINGWCDIGYTTNDGSAPSSTTVPVGAVRVYKATSNYYLAVHAGSGTYYYAAITTTAGGVS